jgi:hypothetical protein
VRHHEHIAHTRGVTVGAAEERGAGAGWVEEGDLLLFQGREGVVMCLDEGLRWWRVDGGADEGGFRSGGLRARRRVDGEGGADLVGFRIRDRDWRKVKNCWGSRKGKDDRETYRSWTLATAWCCARLKVVVSLCCW